MLRALLWKEWKQLGSLRWGSVAAGIVFPLVTVAAMRSVAGKATDMRTLVQDVLPMMLCMGIWPLLALMLVVQALSADRTGGTAAFLLERPVRRRWVWCARLTTAIASMVVVIGAHLLVWAIMATMAGGLGTTVQRSLIVGAMLCVLAVLAGAAAAPFSRTQMQGMLLGLVLGAAPIGIAELLERGFAAYRLGGYPLTWLPPMLLVCGYAVVSFTMDCRGELGGRGRIKRGLVTLAVAAVAIPLTVVASAPGVVRLDARLGLGNTVVLAAPEQTRAFVHNRWQGAGWLIDTSTGDKTRFFSPRVWEAAWSSDGSRIAVLHDGAGLARSLAKPRIEIVDAATGASSATYGCENCMEFLQSNIAWTGDHIVVGALVDGMAGVIVLDPDTGEKVEARIPAPTEEFELARFMSEGVLRIVTMGRQRRARSEASDETVYQATVYRLDAAQGRLVVERDIGDAGYPYWAADSLSPSGRYWLKLPKYSEEDLEIIDIETGDRTPLPAKRAGWLADDRLFWIEGGDDGERRVLIGWPGEAQLVRRFPDGMIQFAVSPDRRRVVVSRFSRGMRDGSPRNTWSRWILDATTGRIEDFKLPRVSLTWADNDRLALIDQGFIGLASRESPTEIQTLIGSRPF